MLITVTLIVTEAPLMTSLGVMVKSLMTNSAGFGGDGIDEDSEVFGAVVGASRSGSGVTDVFGLQPSSIVIIKITATKATRFMIASSQAILIMLLEVNGYKQTLKEEVLRIVQ
ncbi:MAG: hypothetical protein HYY41_02015 [Chloroflexi bacterium]|nr:hypothetical protein [Chloroflexota bacterium]